MSPAMQKEVRAGIERTLTVIRAELYSDDGITLKLREPVYCKPELPDDYRPVPKCEIR